MKYKSDDDVFNIQSMYVKGMPRKINMDSHDVSSMTDKNSESQEK